MQLSLMDGWLYEFNNWVTEEEELDAYAEKFFNNYFAHLPRDVLHIIIQQVLSFEIHRLIGRRRRTISRPLQHYLKLNFEYLFLSRSS